MSKSLARVARALETAGIAARILEMPGETRTAADAARETGFAIGGVAPVGHLAPIPSWFDPRLMDFDLVWAAAGTPRHIFAVAPADLLRLTGARLADFTEMRDRISRPVKEM